MSVSSLFIMKEFATSSKISRLTHSFSILPAECVNPLRVLALQLIYVLVVKQCNPLWLTNKPQHNYNMLQFSSVKYLCYQWQNYGSKYHVCPLMPAVVFHKRKRKTFIRMKYICYYIVYILAVK